MSNDIAVQKISLPAELQETFNTDRTSTLIQSGGFPVLSIRGKAFRVKTGGEEHALSHRDTGEQVTSVELVMLDWQDHVSKIYYKTTYKPGDDSPPVCFSIDGKRPDPQSTEPQAQSCAVCPHAVWGSKITPQGNKTKACGDSRRLAVTFAGDMHNAALGGPMLLRVPAASLKDLSTFARGMMAKGFNASTVVVRIGFDINADFPKLTFKAVRALREDELYIVAELRQSEQVSNIINSGHDGTTTPTPAPMPAARQPVVDTEFEEEPTVSAAPVLAKAAAPAAAPATAPKRAEPAPQEDIETASIEDGLSLDEALSVLDGSLN